MANTSVLDQNGKMRLEMEAEGDRVLLRPLGVIDEDVNFSVILETIQKMQPLVKALHLDLGHVTRMNSCGVREWILLMERLVNLIPCSFVNVNALFVEQANIIPGMLGKKGSAACVISFHAPYHCSTCDSDLTVVLQPSQVQFTADGLPVAPEFTCKKCTKKLDFDWIEEEYFGFIKRL